MEKRNVLILFLIFAVIVFFVIFKVTNGLSFFPPSDEEITKGISLEKLETGWVLKERRFEKIKIIPYVRFKIKNSFDKKINKGTLAFIVTFRVKGEQMTFDSGSKAYLPAEIIEPGEVSNYISIATATNGYKGPSIKAFEENKDKWKKMEATIFVRYKGSDPVKKMDVDIAQKIIEDSSKVLGEEQ